MPDEPEDVDEVILVGGMTRMPAVQAMVKEIFKREPHKGVNPDEVVAVGAAIQGGVLAGEVKDVLLLDVIPLTLGIETLGGVMTPLVERNTTIPTQKKQIFSTAADNQPAVTIVVLQGERKMASDNKEIGRFDLTDIPPSPRGTPQIEVAFDIDADGILHVSAKDLASGKEQKIRIEASSGLSEVEIQKMVKDAELHSEEDKEKREEVEVRNEADSLAFRASKALADYKDKVPEEVAKDVQNHIDKVKAAVEKGNIDEIRKAKQELEAHMQHIGEAMSKAAGAHAGPAAGAASGPNGHQQSAPGAAEEPIVEDAEVEIIDGDKDN